jgi:hypothetical protein
MSVCANQDSFNKSLRSGLKYVEKENQPNKTSKIVGSLIYCAIILWALLLASKIQVQDKIIHIVLALLFAPVYIISYYIGMQN